MSLATRLAALATVIGQTVKPLLYLPVKPTVDDAYELTVATGVAAWRRRARQKAETTTNITRNLTTNLDVVTLNMNAPDAGDYEIFANWRWTYTATSSAPTFEVVLDGVIIETNARRVTNTGNIESEAIRTIRTLTAGAHTVILRMRSGAAGRTVTIQRSLVTAERWA